MACHVPFLPIFTVFYNELLGTIRWTVVELLLTAVIASASWFSVPLSNQFGIYGFCQSCMGGNVDSSGDINLEVSKS